MELLHVLKLVILLCCVNPINSQGSGTTLCTDNGDCTEAGEICIQLTEDSERSCEPDECRTETTCSAMTMQQCLSRGNCDGFGLCSQVPAFGTHACVDPCARTDLNCPTNQQCISRANCAATGTCDYIPTDAIYVCGVCAGVDCNNLGTCLSVTEGSQLIPRCACNSGTVRPNDTSCAEASSVTPPPGTQQTRIQFQVAVINHPYTSAYDDPTSPEYQEFSDRCVAACHAIYESVPGYGGCLVKELREGSIIATMEVIFNNNNDITDAMAFQLLMSNLTARTNAQTNMGEMWWGEYLQIDETRTEFQEVSEEPTSTDSNSAVLPAVLGSTTAVVVIVLCVVLLYYFGRFCRSRYHPGTWEDSEETDTTYHTFSSPHYVYTRANLGPTSGHFGWGSSGSSNWNQPRRGEWHWTNRRPGVFSAR